MNFTELPLEGLKLITLDKFEDERGYFLESFKVSDALVDNHSHSYHNVLRGLHFSTEPQTKIVRVIRGEIFDVVVDVRKGSDTFGGWYANTLSEDKHTALYVPPGFAHGFLVKSDVADVVYKSSTRYNPAAERTLFYGDLAVGINWGFKYRPIVSSKDLQGTLLRKL